MFESNIDKHILSNKLFYVKIAVTEVKKNIVFRLFQKVRVYTVLLQN